MTAHVPPPGGYVYREMPSYWRRRAQSTPRGDLKPSWTVASYRRALNRAAAAAGVPEWNPNQLRHTAASQVRAAWGLDASQMLLGHRHAETTEIYAELDQGRLEHIVLARG